MFDLIYANGDSYLYKSADRDHKTKTVENYLADKLDIKLIRQNTKEGSSNERICRTTIRDILDIKQRFPQANILSIIGFTFTSRRDLWYMHWDNITVDQYDPSDGMYISHEFDQSEWIKEVLIKRFAKRNNFQMAKILKANEEFNTYEPSMFLSSALSLHGYLKSKGVTSIMFSAPPIEINALQGKNMTILLNEMRNDPYIIDFFDFNMTDYLESKGHEPYDFEKYGRLGHHGPAAHEEFANYIYDKYKGDLW